MRKNIIVFFLISVITTKSAFGYIDPGTGGMIIGSIWPVIVGIFAAIGAFFVKYFFKPIKNGVLGVWRKIKGKV